MPEDGDVGAALRDIARTAPRPSERLGAEALVEIVPELAALARTPQDPSWHPEGDVLVHSLWAADLAADHAEQHALDPGRRELLVVAALLHDIGKPDTTRQRNGRLTSWGHAERGADIVREMGRRMQWPMPLVRSIAEIVATHMAHVAVRGEPSAKAVRRLVGRLEDAGTSLEDWAVVVRCDGEARGSAARPDASIPWMRVAERLRRR
jgi:tRNA nucleotidyltransferase (CCA-adding enzyme)